MSSDDRWVSPPSHTRPDPFNKGQFLVLRPRPDSGVFVLDGVKKGSAFMAQDGSDALLIDSETDALALELSGAFGATCTRIEID